MELETIYYVVQQIDGDYAHLQRTDEISDETNWWQERFSRTASVREHA